VGGDRDALEKRGYYNADSVTEWSAEADYVINGNIKMVGPWLTLLNPNDYDEYKHTDALDPCDPTTYLRYSKRNKATNF
jgi:hypothetical protein